MTRDESKKSDKNVILISAVAPWPGSSIQKIIKIYAGGGNLQTGKNRVLINMDRICSAQGTPWLLTDFVIRKNLIPDLR